jgi:hypothetical protein
VPIEIGPSRRLRARRRPPPTQRTPSRSAQADRRPKAPRGRIHSARRPTVGRRLLCRLKSAPQGAPRQASASADAGNAFRSAQADRRPKAFVPIEIGPSRRLKSAPQGAARQASASADAGNAFRSAQADRRPKARLKSAPQGAYAPSVGLRRRRERFSVGAGRPSAEGPSRPNSFGTPRARRRPPPTQGTLFGRHRPTAGRRLLCRLKSAPQGAARQASASADAGNAFRSAQADRRPKAFVPIEIGPSRRLRAKRRPPPTQGTLFGRRRPTVGRRPLEAEFIRHTPRQASASADAGNAFRSAQADRWPKAFVPIEIGPSRRSAPSVGLRRRRERFSVGTGRPSAEGFCAD